MNGNFYKEKALEFVNSIRSDYSLPPLAGLPKGHMGEAACSRIKLKGHCGKGGCVIANALVEAAPTDGSVFVDSDEVVFNDGKYSTVKSYYVPEEVANFITGFDNKYYPELVI